MIHVDRSGTPPPEILASDEVRSAFDDAARFFLGDPEGRRQRRYRFKPVYHRQGQAAVQELFRAKCAFCETPGSGKRPVMLHEFRPLSNALDQKGEISATHYWWLFGVWENLYAICEECSSLKGSRFPVDGERAPGETPPAELDAAEARLLLDPCADEPGEHLVYKEDGRVGSSTTRGIHTIETFSLNRDSLLRLRRQELDTLRREWVDVRDRGMSDSVIRALGDAGQAFAGMRRFFLKEWTEEQPEAVQPAEAAAPPKADLLAGVKFTPEAQAFAFEASEMAQTLSEDFSLEAEAVAPEYFQQTRLVQRIEIENFRILGHISLDIQASGEGRSPWLMLLGENGTGKSSVLQAVALALAGGAYRAQLTIGPEKVLRHGTAQGAVRVFLSGLREPIELGFFEGDSGWRASSDAPKVLLLGYGATRLLPRGDALPAAVAPHARIHNLFNPFVPLLDVPPWLASLPDDRFDGVASVLRELLNLRDDETLVRSQSGGAGIVVRGSGSALTLDELSDGYQSILALACDIMAVVLERWPAAEVAEGIVLLDEIGAHLHPRWQMRIIEGLRRVFPRIQFIATTHNPLCLRGLEDGEVVGLRRRRSMDPMDDRGLVWAQTDLPSVRGLRVDQLLTSEHFGLASSIDPELQEIFEEYYTLRASDQRTAEDEARLQHLTEELRGHHVLGTTLRERLMLELVDEYLARAGELVDPAAKSDLKDETRRRGAEIWARVRASRDPESATGGDA